MKSDFTILDSGYRTNTRKRKIAKAVMIKIIRPSLNVKEKSVELKLFDWASTLQTNVYSRSIPETLHSVWGDFSKFDNSETKVCSSEIRMYSCYDKVIFNFHCLVAVPIGKTCSKSLMKFNNCIFYILFYFIATVSKFLIMF